MEEIKLIAADCIAKIIKKIYAQIAISNDGQRTGNRSHKECANGVNQ